MDTSEIRVLLKDAVKIYKAGPQSETWDHFVTTMHHEGCNTCEAYCQGTLLIPKPGLTPRSIPMPRFQPFFQLPILLQPRVPLQPSAHPCHSQAPCPATISVYPPVLAIALIINCRWLVFLWPIAQRMPLTLSGFSAPRRLESDYSGRSTLHRQFSS